MPLKQFSKILIFKNTPETREAFGVNGNMDNWNGQSFTPSSDRQFNGSYPNPILSNFSNTFFANNLLHAIGTQEPIGAGNTGLNGWNLDPVSSGKAYIIDGFIKAFDITQYEGAVATAQDLNDVENPTVGDQYVVTENNTVYTFTETSAGPPAVNEWVAAPEPIPFFTFNPSELLSINDMLFYGDDPNNLRVAGKIVEIYESGDPEFNQGKRFKLSKENTPDGNAYQDIYYYKNSWNGRGIPVDITEGFYILISVENSNNQRIIYPFLNSLSSNPNVTNSSSQIVEPGTGTSAYTDLIRIKRISEKYKFDQDRASDNNEPQEIIPCTIKRTNSIKTIAVSSGDQEDMEQGVLEPAAFPTVNDFPHWVAYFVNPYGETVDSLLKSSVYAIEINELLPYYAISPSAQSIGNYSNFFTRLV